MDRKNELLVRAYIVLLMFIVLSCVIMWKVFTISILEGDTWREQGNKYVKWVDVEAERGSIFSDDGHVWSTSTQFFEIRLDPAASAEKNFKNHIDSLSYYLARYADGTKTQNEWRSYLTSKRKAYFDRKEKGSRDIPIAQKVNYDLYQRFRKFPLFRLGRNAGGFKVERFSKRVKPYNQLAGRTIGQDRKNAAKIGLEGFWDKDLKGETQKKLMKQLPGVGWISIFDPQDEKVKKGSDIVTTLQVDIQDVVHNELLSGLVHQQAEAGCAIVMEVETGAIVAMSNFSQQENGSYAEVYNHAIGRLSEPGSTFKLATVLSLLDDGLVKLNSKVDVQGGVKKFYDLTMRDDHKPKSNIMDLKTAFAASSNVGIATFANQHYHKSGKHIDFYNKLASYRLTQSTGIALVGEPNPVIKNPDQQKWSGVTVPWMAHGYELMLTPLQVLNFYNAVANNGTMMRPYLVKEVLNVDEGNREFKPEVLKSQIASPLAIAQAKEVLDEVVISGTGSKLYADGYNFSGKTGTARTNYIEVEERKKYNASFAGYFPSEQPKYSMIIVLYDPRVNLYGGSAAGPIFRAIADRCFALRPEMKMPRPDNILAELNLPEMTSGNSKDFNQIFDYVGIDYKKETKSQWVTAESNTDRMMIAQKKIKVKEVPDVRNMGLRDAMYVLENLGLNVRIKGSGKVRRQSIRPGTRINGQEIEIYLN